MYCIRNMPANAKLAGRGSAEPFERDANGCITRIPGRQLWDGIRLYLGDVALVVGTVGQSGGGGTGGGTGRAGGSGTSGGDTGVGGGDTGTLVVGSKCQAMA